MALTRISDRVELYNWILEKSKVDGKTQAVMTEVLDEIVAEAKDDERAAINNGGILNQVDYLAQQAGVPVDQVHDRLIIALTDEGLL